MNVTLRAVEDSDLPIFFEHQRDPMACHRVAFRSRDPDNRDAFDVHWARIRAIETNLIRTILVDGVVAGNLATFLRDGVREVCYWLGREYWGGGVASQALAQFLPLIPWRPLIGRVAADNIASIRVLEKCGFRPIETMRSFAEARGVEIDEVVLRLE